MNSLLLMRNIVKYYGPIKALNNAFFEILPGEVHALLGANGAGKSTLMKVLCGETDFESGEILFDGKTLEPNKYNRSLEYSVGMVHQELSVINELTVAQYIFLGKEPLKGLKIDDHKMIEDTKGILSKIKADISPQELMGNLSPAKQQLVEIAKALSYDLKLLIMDEPTTALGDNETNNLFDVIRKLQKQGLSIIYISHRIDEFFKISQRITVMKDGEYVTTKNTSETNKDELVSLLAGRKLNLEKKISSNVLDDAEIVLEVKNLCTSSLLSNVSFKLKKGEILGFAGLMGSGRSETAKAICGIDQKLSGDIYVNGKLVNINSPKDAVLNGICYLSEDRNKEGAISQRSIIANTVISNLDNYQKGLRLDDNLMLNDAVKFNEMVNTKYFDPHQDIASLSGGNCQKVLIARWLLKDLPIIIFDEPTKGIDVSSKDEIYSIIEDIANKGHSIILISSETDELLRNCDRIIVMSEGKIQGEMSIGEASPNLIMKYSMSNELKEGSYE